MERVRRIMESRRGALEAITKRLIECEVIDGEELRTIIEASIGTPQLVPGTEAERRVPAAPASNAASPLPVSHALPRPATADAPENGLGPADISG
jgi:hypothetical protein